MLANESADVSPDSQSSLAGCLGAATRVSLSPRAAGPSCATMSDDRTEPSFLNFFLNRCRKKIPSSNNRQNGQRRYSRNQEESMSDKSETRQKCGANRSMVTDCFRPMVTQMATIKVCVQLISTFELQGKFFVFPDTHTHTTPPSSARSSSHTIWGITLSTPYIISLIRGLSHPTHAI